MSSTVIASLVLLLSATAVLGTGAGGDAAADGDGSSDCVSQQELEAIRAEAERRTERELAAVKAEMERRVDQLHSQLHYCQNVTVNTLKDLKEAGEGCETADKTALMETNILNIVTQINQKLEVLEEVNEKLASMKKRLDSMETRQHLDDTTGSFLNPANNCSYILYSNPEATSGDYWLRNSPGYAVKVFCDMERVCGCDVGRGEGGGWRRVADINMNRRDEVCPAGFRKVTTSGKTMCGGRNSRCIGTSFSSHGLQYSRVCGKIIGYQFGRTNVFDPYSDRRGSINSIFVDGIVLTHGSPRTHIWTFTAGNNQYKTNAHGCPCNNESSYSGTVPPYVGNDYFCDSGYPNNIETPLTYLTNDPLWDGAGCVRGSCCTFNSPPWFCKTLPRPTTDDIELRLCMDERLSNEDTPFETVELYVQ